MHDTVVKSLQLFTVPAKDVFLEISQIKALGILHGAMLRLTTKKRHTIVYMAYLRHLFTNETIKESLHVSDHGVKNSQLFTNNCWYIAWFPVKLSTDDNSPLNI